MHYYCKAHSSPPFPSNIHFCQLICDPGAAIVYVLERVGAHPLPGSLAQSWWARKWQTLQSTHLRSFLWCHQLIEGSEFISQGPDVHLAGIVLNFTALSCLRSSQGSQWPFVGVRPGGRRESMTCPHAGMPGSGGPRSAATVDPLTTLQTWCIRRAESVRIGVEEPESYPGSAVYDLWAPVFLSVKWGHNTNIAMQLWWAQMQIKAAFPQAFQLWMPLSSHVVCR